MASSMHMRYPSEIRSAYGLARRQVLSQHRLVVGEPLRAHGAETEVAARCSRVSCARPRCIHGRGPGGRSPRVAQGCRARARDASTAVGRGGARASCRPWPCCGLCAGWLVAVCRLAVGWLMDGCWLSAGWLMWGCCWLLRAAAVGDWCVMSLAAAGCCRLLQVAAGRCSFMMLMAGSLMVHAASDCPPHDGCVMPDRSRRAMWPCLWLLADGPWLMAHGWGLMAGADVGR